MIKPMADAKFEMRWNGVSWDVMIEKCVLKDIQDMGQLGQELSELVLKAFEDNWARQLRWFGPVEFDGGVLAQRERPKFRGNK